MLSRLILSPGAGGVTVFLVTVLEFLMAAPILAAAGRRGRGMRVSFATFATAIGSAIVAALLFLSLASLGPTSRPWIGAGLVTCLGMYLAYRFGIARSQSDYGAYLFDKLVPHPRGRFRHSATGVAIWAISVECLKIGVAWIGVSLLVDPTVATIAFFLGALSAALPGLLGGHMAYHRVSPSAVYSVTMIFAVIYGYAHLIELVHAGGWL